MCALFVRHPLLHARPIRPSAQPHGAVPRRRPAQPTSSRFRFHRQPSRSARLRTLPGSRMAPTSLNPAARPFVPGSPAMPSNEPSEDNITQEELEELELTEEWVSTMAEMEEAECEHLIELALRFAPKSTLDQIQKQYGGAAPRSGKAPKPHKSRAV